MEHHPHSFSTDNIAVLHHETGWFHHGVAEAIYITNTNPILNWDWGQHNLPRIHWDILQSCDLDFVLGSCDHATGLKP